MRRVLATDFGIWPAFEAIERISDAMLVSSEHWTRLANYVLLYDQIVIPTGNLQILPVLRLMLGEGVFDDLVRNKGIVLARYDKWFGYVGNGGGLVFFTINNDPTKPTQKTNLATSYFVPLDEAIDVVLSNTNPPSTLESRTALKSLLLDNVVSLPTERIANELKDEAYKDILDSPYLRDFLALRNAGRSLDHLTGIGPDQFTIFNPHLPLGPKEVLEIRSVLRVAFENFLLSVGGYTESTEITGDATTLSILQAKGQRLGFSPEGNNAFARIQKISGVPDLGVAFANKQLSPSQLLDLRYSKHGQALRDWFAKGSPSDSAESTLRRYVDSLGKPSWIDTIPSKLLRFAVTTGIGALEPLSGAAASAIDSFYLSKWFPSKSPRLFMKQAKVMLTNSPVIPKPIMHGRDRNQPCSCGSGKKFKKCCGR
jgi:hypothetical protein